MRAAVLVGPGRVEVRPVDLGTLVTDRRRLADVARAFDDVAHRREGVVEAVVELNAP